MNKDPNKFEVERVQGALKSVGIAIAKLFDSKDFSSKRNKERADLLYDALKLINPARKSTDKKVMICAFLNINRILKYVNK